MVRLDEPVTWVIREREDRDLQACAALLAQVHADQRYPIHWPDDPHTWLTPHDMAAAWVAVREHEVIGHVCLVRRDLATPELKLNRLFVSPLVVGNGVGKGLVVHATDWARRHRSRLTLDMLENCANAVTLYTRLGWRLTERSPIDWGDGVAHCLLHFDAPSG